MNKIVIAFIISIFTVSIGLSQTIEYKKVFGGYEFSQNGNTLSMNEVNNAVINNPEAFKLMGSAATTNDISMVFSFIGGGLIGYPIGTAIGGGKPNWLLAGIGVGVTAFSFVLSSNAGKKAVKAVDIYNSSLNNSTYKFKPELRFIAGGNGLGLSLSF